MYTLICLKSMRFYFLLCFSHTVILPGCDVTILSCIFSIQRHCLTIYLSCQCWLSYWSTCVWIMNWDQDSRSSNSPRHPVTSRHEFHPIKHHVCFHSRQTRTYFSRCLLGTDQECHRTSALRWKKIKHKLIQVVVDCEVWMSKWMCSSMV